MLRDDGLLAGCILGGDGPAGRADIHNRIALGPYVIDEERVTGYSPGGPDVVRAVLVYRFAGDLIREILILS